MKQLALTLLSFVITTMSFASEIDVVGIAGIQNRQYGETIKLDCKESEAGAVECQFVKVTPGVNGDRIKTLAKGRKFSREEISYIVDRTLTDKILHPKGSIYTLSPGYWRFFSEAMEGESMMIIVVAPVLAVVGAATFVLESGYATVRAPVAGIRNSLRARKLKTEILKVNNKRFIEFELLINSHH
jgi:hypothetical protein